MDVLSFKIWMVRQELELPVSEEATTNPTFDLGDKLVNRKKKHPLKRIISQWKIIPFLKVFQFL